MQLAQEFDCGIISADSRQIYKQIDIGTAKPTKEELNTVLHHFVDHIELSQNYSAGDFEREAITLINELHESNPVQILCGGTGLYIKAVLEGLDQFPKVDPSTKTFWNKKYEDLGISYLQESLQKVDPRYFEIVDIQNPHRLIRALCVCDSGEYKFSDFLDQQKEKRLFHPIRISLYPDKPFLHQKIHDRVDQMRKMGLESEAKSLYHLKNYQSLQTVGYQELFKHFDGDWSVDEAFERIKIHTRQYAKRQLTWNNKYFNGERFHDNSLDAIQTYIYKQLQLSH